MKFARYVAIATGLFLVVFGAWAFFGPQSFFDRVATFKPYNKHFIHDIGALQIGIGVTLLLALSWDALSTALGGAGVGAAVHAVSHWIDKDLGGRDSDPYTWTAIAVLVLGAAVASRRGRAGVSG